VRPADGSDVEMNWPGSRHSRPEGELPLAGVSNYFIGNDPAAWIRGAEHFGRVRYRRIYPGVDLVFHAGQQPLEYDFIVAPGADPAAIRLSFGSSRIRLDQSGDLMVAGQVRQHRPLVYQERGGKRVEIAGNYEIAGRQVRFRIGRYDRRLPLIIDPVLTYASIFTGTGALKATRMAMDFAGNTYISGAITSLDFPLKNPMRTQQGTPGVYLSRSAGASWSASTAGLATNNILGIAADQKNALVAYAATSKGAFKTSDGGQTWSAIGGLAAVGGGWTCTAIDPLASSTIYFGGFTGLFKSTDNGATWTQMKNAGGGIMLITLDPVRSGVIYMAASGSPYTFVSFDGGTTWFVEGPPATTLAVAVDPTNSNKIYSGHAGVGLQVSTNGGLNYAAANLGISPSGASGAPIDVNAILIDPRNPQNVYVGTDAGLFRSSNGAATFAAATGAIAGFKIFNLAFDPQSSANIFAGTSGGGVFYSSDSGNTWNPVGPAKQDVQALATTSQTVYAALYVNQDAFVAKVDPTGSSLVYSTYYGGSGADQALGMDVDSAGSAYVCGQTDSTDLPTRNPLQKSIGGNQDAFLLRLDPTGSNMVFSTYFGGIGLDFCHGLKLDQAGNIYITGSSFVNSGLNNFPTTPNSFQSPNGKGQDCFVSKLTGNGSAVVYSLLLGGSQLEYCSGITVDPSGSAYVTGFSTSTDFPVSGPRLNTALKPGTHQSAFVTGITADGSLLIFSSLFGGNTGDTQPTQIAINQSGRLYITGSTGATDFQTTSGALNANNPGQDGFIVAVDSTGALAISTLLPGTSTSFPTSILPLGGNIWIVGGTFANGTSTFTPTADAADSRPRPNSGFLMELDGNISQVMYATLLGGTGGSYGLDLAGGPNGSLAVMGSSNTSDVAQLGATFGTNPSPDFVMFLNRFDNPTGNGPFISIVEDGATSTPGPVAAGALVELKGVHLAASTQSYSGTSLSTNLAGTTASVNGTLAGLYYVSDSQINLQLPSGTPAGKATVTVTTAAGTSQPASFTVGQSAPHIYVFGANRAAVRNPDASINTSDNPTTAGAAVTVYFTGIGAVDNPVADGQPAPTDTLARSTLQYSAKVGTADAEVLFCGLTPTTIGLAQANIVVPNLQPGDYAVTLTIGGVASNSPVISIK
ncbi:MAG: SBBP repeat-containing protein, partial [Acidobacteriia bacterium]|nr:SBBP repeat-containing protein [Terriglobia bacterium]